MKLSIKISIFIILILMFSLSSVTLLSYYQMKDILIAQLKDKLMNIATYASEDYMVKEAFKNGDKIRELNEHIEKIRVETDVDFIVVFNMDSIRLTHPVEINIGRKFEGGDEAKVLKDQEKYISQAQGTLGISLRAFVPIFYEGEQVGAVCVGSTVAKINKEMSKKIQLFIPFIIIGMVLGIYFAFVIALSIKNEILGLEPREITLLLKEKEAILDNVKEGIVTLNENGKLIQYNREAARILGLNGKDMNIKINELSKMNKIAPELENFDTSNDFEVKVRPGITILCKYNILKNDKKHVIGHVINFRDLSEVKKMSEELTGIQKMAWSLRAQNHEFMNKLHTISGLIQLEEYDEAIKYISKTANSGNDITGTITGKIKNLNIAALLLAKYYKAEELRIKFEIDKESNLKELPDLISEDDLGSVIGNLIENSLEAVSVDGTGKVYLKISDIDNVLIIEVKDNGPGISDDIAAKIFERNFSTKTEHHGYGMFIVKNIIENANGIITLSSDKGASWHIEIPMKSGENE
jgi:two-component system CitB family sensor kinase